MCKFGLDAVMQACDTGVLVEVVVVVLVAVVVVVDTWEFQLRRA